MKIRSLFNRRAALALAAATMLLVAYPACAGDIIDWNSGSAGSFGTNTFWTNETGGANVVPTSGTIANIINGGTATIGTGDSFTVDEIWAGNGGNGNHGTGNVSQTGGLLTVNNWFVVGRGGQTGTYAFSGGTINKGGGGNTIIGDGGGNGTLTMSGANTAFNISGELWIGQAGGTGNFILNAGSVTTNTWAVIARDNNSAGTLTINGGIFTHTGGNGDFEIGSFGTGHSATLNLNGGLLNTNFIRNESGSGSTSTFNFNGGTLQANAADAGFLGGHGAIDVMNVRNGGAIIDTNGNNIGITQALSHSIISGDNATDGGLTKIGAGTLTLTGANTYTGTTNVEAGTLAITGGSISGDTANPGIVVNQTGAGTATMTQSGGAVSGGTGEIWVGNNAGSTGIYNLSAGTLTANNYLAVGRQGGTGTLNLSGTGAITKTGGGNVEIGTFSSGATSTGTLTMTGGTVTVNSGATLIGTGGNGAVTISGGIYTQNSAFTSIGASGTGSMTVTGGSFVNNAGDFNVGDNGGSNGTLNVSGTGRVNVGAGNFYVGKNGTGVVNLGSGASGGLLTTKGIIGAGGGTFNFNGGTLQANAPNSNFLSGLAAANVQAGGATIDTQANSITIGQALVHDTMVNAPAIDGGVTKIGTGTLTLTADNTYTGGTTVNGGTLVLGAAHADGSGTLTVNSGGKVVVAVAGGDTSNDPILNGGEYDTAVSDALTGPTTLENGALLKNTDLTANDSSSAHDSSISNNIQNGGLLTIGPGTSTLDFGAGNTGAIFDFSGLSASSTGTLDIDNWTGRFTDGTNGGDGLDQLIIGGTPLTSSQLNDFVFVNPDGMSGTFTTKQLADGEISPAPEPAQVATLSMIGLGLGGLLLRARKRTISAKSAS